MTASDLEYMAQLASKIAALERIAADYAATSEEAENAQRVANGLRLKLTRLRHRTPPEHASTANSRASDAICASEDAHEERDKGRVDAAGSSSTAKSGDRSNPSGTSLDTGASPERTIRRGIAAGLLLLGVAYLSDRGALNALGRSEIAQTPTPPAPAVNRSSNSAPAEAPIPSATPRSTTASSKPQLGVAAVPNQADVAAARSRYGQFDLTVSPERGQTDNPRCLVTFQRTGGAVTPLLVVDDCIGTFPTTDIVGRTVALDTTRFPVVVAGREYHLFEIAAMRGGNGADFSQYWTVIVGSDTLWVSPQFDANLETATVHQGSPPTLMLVDPPTTLDSGARFTVHLGAISEQTLPMLPSWPLDRRTEVFVGNLRGGYHATGWKAVIQVGGKDIVLDEAGTCSLPDVGEEHGKVRLKATVANWSDGRVIVACQDVESEP